MPETADPRYNFEFHPNLDPTTTRTLSQIMSNWATLAHPNITLELHLTEDEAIAAIQALHPDSVDDPREAVRHCLKADTVDSHDLFDVKLPRFAEEYSETTGLPHEPKAPAEIPIQTVAMLLALGDANHWERYEKDWDITTLGIAILNAHLQSDGEEPLDPLTFLTRIQ